MSFDFGVWYSGRPLNASEADAAYQALAEGTELPPGAPIAASSRVAAFLAALGARYPDLDTVPDEEVDDSPWASGFETSDRHALLVLRWSAADAVVEAVVALAAEHRLVLYDPQGGEVHLPPSLGSPRKRWPFGRR